MARRLASLLSTGASVLGLAAVVLVLTGAGGSTPTTPAGGHAVHPVVVELFTSQGCSSCPPADRLLTKLGAETGTAVIPLAFHVDIWNHIGWTDPFSSKTWTTRQVGYAKRFGLDQLFTPQAVVDGGAHVVGSDESGLRAAIASAAARPAAEIALHVDPAPAPASASKVHVDAEVELPDGFKGRKLDLLFALYETGLVTPVGRGENGGRTLQNDFVVRSLVRAGRLSGDKPGKTRHEETISLEKGWHRSRLGVAAFLQDSASLEIHGASARALDAGGDSPSAR